MSDPTSHLHAFALRVLTGIGLVALALFLWRIADVLLLAFGAGLVAIVLHAAAGPVQRLTRLPASAALGLVVAALSLLIAALVWLFGAELTSQATELLGRLPDAWAAIRDWLQQHAFGRFLVQRLQDVAADLGPLAAKVTQWTALASGAVLSAVLVVFGGVYLAADPHRYRTGLLDLFPPSARERVGDTVDAATQALRKWLIGQVLVMAVVGTLTGVGLWLVGMPAPLALGLMAGVLEFVPYIGPIAAAIPGLLLALTVDPFAPLYALAVYVVVQQIESNVVTPLVARRMLELPPAFVVFAIVALGTVLGPLGWILAVPLTVVLTVSVGRLYVRETLGTPVTIPGESRPPGHVHQGVLRVHRSVEDARHSLQSGAAPDQLRQCVDAMHRDAGEVLRACSGTRPQADLRESLARLDRTADRAMQACRDGGRSVDPQLRSAVKRAHDEIASLRRRLQIP